MKKGLLKEALAIARRKQPSHPEKDRFCHYSFVVQGNQIVEYGWNHSGQPKIHHGYNRQNRGQGFKPKTHAESAAYYKAKGLLDKEEPFDIINVRLSKQGELRNSRPCSWCAEFLTALGCRYFYFSSFNGSFQKVRF